MYFQSNTLLTRDIPDFVLNYFSEVNSFRKSLPNGDLKVVSSDYQELWGRLLLGYYYMKYSRSK